MNFWKLAILTLIIQESFTTAGIMTKAYTEHHSLLLFTFIFFAATISEIFIFYYLGKYLQLTGKNHRVVSWTKKYIAGADHFIGMKGKKIFLLFLSASVFPPSVTAFISSWIALSLKEVFILILIGNTVWYAMSWIMVLSVGYFVKNVNDVLLAVLGVTFAVALIQKIITRYVLKK